METKNIRIEKPYCTRVDYKFELEKFYHKFEVMNLTEKKRAVFEHKLEVYGYYQGKRVLIICNEDGLDVRPLIPPVHQDHVTHPNCRCSLI